MGLESARCKAHSEAIGGRLMHIGQGLLVFLFALSLNGPSEAQQSVFGANSDEANSIAQDSTTAIRPVRTSSPRDTVASLIRVRDELEPALLSYRNTKSAEGARHVESLVAQLSSLVDLSGIPEAARREVGTDTVMAVLDVIGRTGVPPPENIPDVDTFGEDESVSWRLPGTPLRIIRIEDGPRQEQFLFSARTVTVAPRFLEGIEDLPLNSSLDINSWTRGFPQITGPLIPAALVNAMPERLLLLQLGTPRWKIIAVICLAALTSLAVMLWHRLASRINQRRPLASAALRALSPIGMLLAVIWMEGFINNQINTSGKFSSIVEGSVSVVFFIGLSWLFWLVCTGIAEWIILSPSIPDQSLNASLLRLIPTPNDADSRRGFTRGHHLDSMRKTWRCF